MIYTQKSDKFREGYEAYFFSRKIKNPYRGKSRIEWDDGQFFAKEDQYIEGYFRRLGLKRPTSIHTWY
jgi:hypothetical protein